MSVNYVELGVRIRKARERKHMSQAEVAFQTGLSVQHISNIENARSKIGLETLVKIANALEITVDEAMSDSLKAANQVFSNEIGELIEEFTDQQLRMLPRLLREYRYMSETFSKTDKDKDKDMNEKKSIKKDKK